MTSQRVQAPPVNLKERIAVFQQRNVSSHNRQSSTSPSSVSPPTHSTGLRDKIAQFEQKGGVPVPRGSFGLGAPPVAGNRQSRRTGELYGNRIPSVLRSSGGISFSRSSSPLLSGTFTPSARSRSPSVDGDALSTDQSPSLPSPSQSSPVSIPQPHSPSSPNKCDHSPSQSPSISPRKDYFIQALEAARRNSRAFDGPKIHRLSIDTSTSDSPSPSTAIPLPQLVFLEENRTHRVPNSTEAAEPFYVSSPSGSPEDSPETSFVDKQEMEPMDCSRNEQSVTPQRTEEPFPLQPHDISEEPSTLELGPMNESETPSTRPCNTSTIREGDSQYSEVLDASPPEECTKDVTLSAPIALVHVPGIRVMLSLDDTTAEVYTTLTPQVPDFREDIDEGDVPSSSNREGNNVQVVEVEEAEESSTSATRLSLTSQSDAPDSVPSPSDSSSAENTSARSFAVVPPRLLISSESDEPYNISDISANISAGDRETETPLEESHVSEDETGSQGDQLPSANKLLDKSAEDAFPSPENGFSKNTDQEALTHNIPIVIEAPSLLLDTDTVSEEHHIHQTTPSYQFPISPSCSLAPNSPTTPRDRRRSAPIINVIKPNDSDNFSAPTSPVADQPSTSEPSQSRTLKDDNLEPFHEFGKVSLHMHSHSYSHSHRSLYAEPEFASSLPRFDPAPVSFSAVVHGKVTEIPSSTTSPLREHKQSAIRMSRLRRPPNGNVDSLQGSSFGDLEVLVKEAVLLEKMLLEEDCPKDQRTTVRQFLETTPKINRHPDKSSAEKRTKSSSKQSEQRHRPLFHRALSSPSAAKTIRSRSIDAIREKALSGSSRPLTADSSPQLRHKESLDGDADTITENDASVPTKSRHRRYLSTIRRLAVNSNVIPAIFPRKSHSTSSDFSSESSTSVATPPDHASSYTPRRNRSTSYNKFAGSSLLSVELPSLSLKANSAITRVGTIADKLWKRSRTKSSASSSEVPDTQTLPPPLVLSVPETMSDSSIPLSRSIEPQDRPMSWDSVGSSTSSSPLDRELFDAFPSVPQATPTLSFNRRPSGRPQLALSRNGKISALGSSTLPQRRPALESGRYDSQQASRIG